MTQQQNVHPVQPRLPGFWQTFCTVYGKDSRAELRSPGAFVAPPFFALVLAALYGYVLQPSVFADLRNLHGALLATLFFTSAFVSARNIQAEKEDGALRVMLACPGDPMGMYLGKTLALWQMQAGFALAYTPLYHLFLRGRMPTLGVMAAPILFLSVAAVSLAALGVLLSYVAAGNRLREMLLPLLLFPVALPVLILAADAMAVAGATAFPWTNLAVLLSPGVLFLALGSALYTSLAAEE